MFSGCAGVKNREGAYRFPIVVLLDFEIESGKEITDLNLKLFQNGFDRDYNIEYTANNKNARVVTASVIKSGDKQKVLRVKIAFNKSGADGKYNLPDFLRFNGIDTADIDFNQTARSSYTGGAFVNTARLEFTNPLYVLEMLRVEQGMTETEMDKIALGAHTVFPEHLDDEYITSFVFVYHNRLSRVEGAYKTEGSIGQHNYFFYGDDFVTEGGAVVPLVETIKITDRSANQPLWYLVAILATGVFMVVFYFVTKKLSVKV
jgi:hypothetical protein